MLRAQLAPDTARPTNDDRHFELAARRVVQHARVVGDLVVREQEEAHVHAFNDDAQPRHRGADAHAHEPVLADGGVEQAHVAVLFVQAVGDLRGLVGGKVS